MKIQEFIRNKPVLMLSLLALMTIVAMPSAAQYGPGPGTACCLAPSTLAASAEETTSLTLMREEEKLARDVYQYLYGVWKLRIFDNIARSEARHFEAIGTLLVRYGIPDPAQNNAAGAYTNPNFKTLYDKLTGQGANSLKDALEVGVLIEKADISDLESALKATDKADIKTVYTNLLAGSLNHLDAFETNLEILASR